MTNPAWLSLFTCGLAAGLACRTGPVTVAGRDAARVDVASSETEGPPILQIRLDGSLPGHAADLERPDDCSFTSLWRAMVDEAAVIGYCTAVAVCDTNAASTDAGTAACTPLADLGKAVLVFTDGRLVLQGPGYTVGCSAFVFDDQGRLVSGNVPILDWADCRWDSYAGKSYYYRCVSE